MDLQNMFERMVKGVEEQGRPSIVVKERADGGRQVNCKYAGPDGLACAVGQLFDKREDAERADTCMWGVREVLSFLYPNTFHKLTTDERYKTIEVLNAVQQAHDYCGKYSYRNPESDFLELFRRSVAEVARRFKLTYPFNAR